MNEFRAKKEVVVRVVKRVYKDIVVVPKGKKVTKKTLFRLAQEEGLNGWQEVKGSGTAEEIG